MGGKTKRRKTSHISEVYFVCPKSPHNRTLCSFYPTMRLSFYGPSGCTSMLSRHDGHREVPYLFSSLSRGKGAKILTLVFLSGEVKSDSCFIF